MKNILKMLIATILLKKLKNGNRKMYHRFTEWYKI